MDFFARFSLAPANFWGHYLLIAGLREAVNSAQIVSPDKLTLGKCLQAVESKR